MTPGRRRRPDPGHSATPGPVPTPPGHTRVPASHWHGPVAAGGGPRGLCRRARAIHRQAAGPGHKLVTVIRVTDNASDS